MAVAWSGFPMAAFVNFAKPLGSAKYVQMETFLDPKTAPGQKELWYPWPYVEGLTIAGLAAGQLPRGGMFVFRGCDSVKRRPTPPRSLSKGKCRKGRTKTVSTSGGFFFTGDRGFESFPLQRRVCEPSVPQQRIG